MTNARPTEQTTIDTLKNSFGNVEFRAYRGRPQAIVPVGIVHDVLTILKDQLSFNFLVDVTCVDYLQYRDATNRFGLVYLLANTETGERATVRTFVNDPDPTVPTVVDLWEGANWLEREVWDLFGIHFTGHPDLRRIVLPEAFTSHPLRKDYPLQGRGERHNHPVITRAEG